MKIEALLFDMDGLLIDSERVVQRAWEAAGEEMGYSHLGSHIYHTLGMNRASRDRYFEEMVDPQFPHEEFARRNGRVFYEIVEKEGIGVKTGARELLEYGKSHGYKLAVATSSRRGYAEKILTDAGIYQYFDGMISGDMVEHSKPDPEIYLKASALIGVEPEYCMALEDAPAGIRSAYAAGMIPVLIPDLLKPPEEVKKLAHRTYETLHQVIALLEQEHMT